MTRCQCVLPWSPTPKYRRSRLSTRVPLHRSDLRFAQGQMDFTGQLISSCRTEGYQYRGNDTTASAVGDDRAGDVEPASNGHVQVGPHGQGMWSMVLEYSRPEHE